MPKQPAWPKELRTPIVLSKFLSELDSTYTETGFLERKMHKAVMLEIARRISVIAGFLNADLRGEQSWIFLLWRLCDHWGIPAFQIAKHPPRKAGRRRKWTEAKQCELFADVMNLAATAKMTEHSACLFIAKNRRRFGNRYLMKGNDKAVARTLHRQFLEAKKATQDYFFRLIHFGDAEAQHFHVLEYGPELVRMAIKRYAHARKSVGPQSA